MRLVKRSIERDGSGFVTLYPEEPEDMWHAYNLIRPGDLLNASAIRRVTTESATGSTSSQRVHTYLSIRVRSLDFDPQAGQLHVSGQIATENRYTKIGQYHTLDLELLRNFTLTKDSDASNWDSIALKQLEEATDPNRGAEAIAVIMQEGLANIAFITATQTILKQRVETNIPRKRSGRTADHDKGLEKFFATVLETLQRQLETLNTSPSSSSSDDFTTRPILIASPGFTAQSFLKYVTTLASSTSSKSLTALLKTMIPVHSSTGHLHSLPEILSNPTIQAQLSTTKYFAESQLMNQFLELLRKDDGRAWYGPREVETAVEKGAVGRGGGVLLISNKLFRSQDVGTRKRWVGLVDRVRERDGGEVRVLSSEHESGKRLEDLGGIAAILTFPIEEMDEEEEAEQETGDGAAR